MIEDSCSKLPDLAEPPQVDPYLSYLAGINAQGEFRILSTPAKEALCFFDGVSILFADGSPSRPIRLPNLGRTTDPVGITGAEGIVFSKGKVLWLLTHQTSVGKMIVLRDDNVFLEDAPAGYTLPKTGFGVAFKLDNASAPIWSNTAGLVNIGSTGIPGVIGPGSESQMLVMKSGVPTWSTPEGAVASGGAISNLEAVEGSRPTASTANWQVPQFVLTDGVTTVTLTGVNVTLTALTAGLGGLDTGSWATNWYYVYVISDGLGGINCIASLSPSAPNLTSTPSYSFYSFIGVVRYTGTFKTFAQKGRKFYIEETEWGSNLSITTSLAVVSSGTSLLTIIPPICKRMEGNIGGSITETASRRVQVAMSALGLGRYWIGNTEGMSTDVDNFSWDVGHYEIGIADPNAPVVYWKAVQNSNRRRITVSGYTI